MENLNIVISKLNLHLNVQPDFIIRNLIQNYCREKNCLFNDERKNVNAVYSAHNKIRFTKTATRTYFNR